jgi:CubicO group peptidase (beta-lactamase class C family)
VVRAIEVLEEGIADGLHIGAQLYVSERGEPCVDIAMGDARDGVAMTPDTLMIWFSMTKAVTSVAVAQLWERGLFDIDDPVARHIPEFGANGKHAVTIWHLLTHTAGIPFADDILNAAPWRESREANLERIYAARLDYAPGTRAGYHPASSMSVLGELVVRLSGQPFDEYVRNEIFLPLDMTDCWVGMPETQYEAYGDRIGLMHNTDDMDPTPVPLVDSVRAAATPMPGSNGRGPMRQFARLYEMLVGNGERDGVRLLSPVTVAAISARHRTEMLDEIFGVVLDWSLGFAVDTFAMGRHCSRRTFGHGGHQSSVAFCDPVHDVVVAVVCNGMPGRDPHNARLDALSTAVYLDLGLAKAGDVGRVKPYPTQGL